MMLQLQIRNIKQTIDKLHDKINTLIQEKKSPSAIIHKLTSILENKIPVESTTFLLTHLTPSPPFSFPKEHQWILHLGKSQMLNKNTLKNLASSQLYQNSKSNLSGIVDNLQTNLQTELQHPILQYIISRHFSLTEGILFPINQQTILKIVVDKLFSLPKFSWEKFSKEEILEFWEKQKLHLSNLNSQIINYSLDYSFFLHFEIQNTYFQKLTEQYQEVISQLDLVLLECVSLPNLSHLIESKQLDTVQIQQIRAKISKPKNISTDRFPEWYQHQEILMLRRTKLNKLIHKLDENLHQLSRREIYVSNFLENRTQNISLRHQNISHLSNYQTYRIDNSQYEHHMEKKNLLDVEINKTHIQIKKSYLKIENISNNIEVNENKIKTLEVEKLKYDLLYHSKFQTQIQSYQLQIDNYRNDISHQKEYIKTQQQLEEKFLELKSNLQSESQELENNLFYLQNSMKKKVSHIKTQNIQYQRRVKVYQSFQQKNRHELKKLSSQKEILLSQKMLLDEDIDTIHKNIKEADVTNQILGTYHREINILSQIEKINIQKIELELEILEFSENILEPSLVKDGSMLADDTELLLKVSPDEKWNMINIDYDKLARRIRNFKQKYYVYLTLINIVDKPELSENFNVSQELAEREKKIIRSLEEYYIQKQKYLRSLEQQKIDNFLREERDTISQDRKNRHYLFNLTQLKNYLSLQKEQIKIIEKLS